MRQAACRPLRRTLGVMSELIEDQTFSTDRAALKHSDHGVYRFCTFEAFEAEGPHIGAAYIGCKFSSVDLYWALFNCAVVVSSTFEGCVFRGASFAGCQFVDCEFIRCRFVPDNVGGACTSSDTRWYGCIAKECEGWESLINQ